MEKLPSLEEREAETRTQSRKGERQVLVPIVQLLDQLLLGFQQIGTFNKTDDNQLEQVWFYLTVRAFNSLRQSYSLLESGYYSQSMILIRAAFEDWLVCEDCKTHPNTVDAILQEGKRLPNTNTMADRLEEPLKQEWNDIEGDDGIYGLLSTFSHPRYRALAVLLDSQTTLIRLGPTYDEKLFLVASNYLLLALIRMMEYLCRLVPPIEPNWLVETKPVVDNALECRREVLRRANARLPEVTKEPRHDHPDP